MLTDGNNEFYDLPDGSGGDPSTPSDFTAYGRVNAPGPVGLASSTTGGGVTILNNRMTAICTAMKAEKVKIYTIIFGGAPNATTQALYQSLRHQPVDVLLCAEQRRARQRLHRHRRPARQPADHRVTYDGDAPRRSSAATGAPPRSSSR